MPLSARHSVPAPTAPAPSTGTTVVYDFLAVPGGAEAVTLHWLSTHPDWSLVTGFVDENAFPPASLPLERITALGARVRHPARQALQVMGDFRRHGELLSAADRVLFSGVYAPVGVHARPDHGNFYYCHTPPRFAYDLEAWYRERTPAWQRPALSWLASRVRRNFEQSLARMQSIAANSETVRGRLRQYLGIEHVTVIPPPVNTAQWSWIDQGDYYLSTARLEPYKRVDWAVRAFRDMPDRRLVIASGGSQLEALKALAAGCDNIRFTGWLDGAELRRLVGNCIATVYLARDEDFGLSPVESMAAGKPVIGVREGGLAETVIDGATGILIDPADAPRIDALADAVRTLSPERARALRRDCETRARRYSTGTFDREISTWLGEAGTPPAATDPASRP
ncbi:MAG: glycosyltransferase [Xanthomonadales bacterium]|jgi:glycosyltransferase involved in cell wall biosynthesis|nr:glycosyltransferase [Xanthomonadales bacterium]